MPRQCLKKPSSSSCRSSSVDTSSGSEYEVRKRRKKRGKVRRSCGQRNKRKETTEYFSEDEKDCKKAERDDHQPLPNCGAPQKLVNRAFFARPDIG